MLNDPPNLNFLWASLIVEECVRSGVDFFCVSPGSRSAPLAMAVAAAGPIRSAVHYDERGAAYHALGYAKSTGRPAAFICTSGSAVANALPAVIEASQSQVPLLIVTADRPPELQDTGANQTIDQTRIFGDCVRWFYTLPCPSEEHPPEAVLSAVDQAIHRATTPPAGPVHLNCMYREPLHPKQVPFNAHRYAANLASWFDGPFTQYARPSDALSDGTVETLRSVFGETTRGLIVAGEPSSRGDIEAIERFATNIGWPLLADIASGLRLGATTAHRITQYDALLASKYKDALRAADLILHFGRPPASKALLRFLAETPERRYIHVANHPFRHDPLHRVTHRVQTSARAFAEALSEGKGFGVDGAWRDGLVAAGRGIDRRLDEFVHACSTYESAVVRPISLNAPEHSIVFLGNSLPIRHADFWSAGFGPKLTVAVNRGHSGIDGNIATAAGWGRALNRPVTAVLGDLAALHDLNSLVLCKDLRAAFVLVVLNNDGGGIFSRLPINDGSKAFERFFTTPHGLTFEHAAKQFGLQYEYATEAKPFAAAFAECHSRGGASLIEYRTETVLDERKLDLLVEQGLANSLREGRSGSEPRAQVGHTVGH